MDSGRLTLMITQAFQQRMKLLMRISRKNKGHKEMCKQCEVAQIIFEQQEDRRVVHQHDKIIVV